MVTWAPPCAAVAGLQGATPSPEGGSPGVWDLKGVKKTPLSINQTLKSPVRIGKRSVPHRFESWNMVLRHAMWGGSQKTVESDLRAISKQWSRSPDFPNG